MSTNIPAQQRWWALIILCLGVLMIVLDTTIVNVALPSIQKSLAFTETALVWVVNIYILTFGGFLLLGGRLGDLLGPRKVFLAGLLVFTLASLGCGVAQSQGVLIIARAVQGLGGAVVSAVALSIIMNLFTEPVERAKAMGVYGFVCAGGGSVGVLLGGLLTSFLSWHWIFLVNLPIGLLVYILCKRWLPDLKGQAEGTQLDIPGAISITLSLMLAVYAIVGGNEAGWLSVRTLSLLGTSILMLVAFVIIESRTAHPLVPLSLFQRPSVKVSNIVAVLWAAAMFAWFFISALYMQWVLQYTPMQVGLAFLPANLIMALFSLGVSARIVVQFGIRASLAGGLMIATVGLIWFGMMPAKGTFLAHVLPAMVLLGVGGGIAFNPMLLAAMNGVEARDSGLASGVVNTAFMMGGALGLAILASVAAAHTDRLKASGLDITHAMAGGYSWAFALGAVGAGLAALIGWFWLPKNIDAPSQVVPPMH